MEVHVESEVSTLLEVIRTLYHIMIDSPRDGDQISGLVLDEYRSSLQIITIVLKYSTSRLNQLINWFFIQSYGLVDLTF
jgi:hypothetical protein